MFQNSGRKPKKLTFYIDKKEIEIVQDYTYIGITFPASGSFSVAQKTLSNKAINSLFKIRQHINLLKLKLNNAMKIFDSVILPIVTYAKFGDFITTLIVINVIKFTWKEYI